MNLSQRILLAAGTAVAAVTVAALLVQRSILEREGTNAARATMRSVLLQAEATRDSVSGLATAGAFDRPKLLAEAKASADLRQTTLYNTIPVVAAWNGIQKVADAEQFNFRVVRFNPRNPANTPTEDEAVVLRQLEQSGADEYFQAENNNHEVVYARPIRLTADCLACHGDPSRSPTGDGKDALGYTMEGWKEGDLRGAFILKSSRDKVDRVVQAGLLGALGWIGPLSIVIALGFLWFNRRHIAQPLRQSAVAIGEAAVATDQAARQISAAAHAIAKDASEQAAALEETSASVEQLTSTTKTNADHTLAVRGEMAQTLAATESGNTAVVEAVRLIDATSAASRDMTQAMDGITKASQAIAGILKTIDEIAFQTNLLALNAAVEAARAGQHGAGFAVVADEVRSLAKRSADAARETATLIQDCVSRSQNGHQINSRVAESLGHLTDSVRAIETQFSSITTKVKGVDHLLEGISTASTEQRDGMVQISQATVQMDRLTQANAASAEETASSGEMLLQQARGLRLAVGQLQVLVEGAGSAEREVEAPPPSAPPPQEPAATPRRPARSEPVAARRPATAARTNA